MCLINKGPKAPRPPQVAAYDNAEADASASIEARLRRRRAGAANDILTGPVGIPGTTPVMGGVAQ